MKLQNETAEVAGRRHGKWYDDACGTAFAMELVGERWSLLIVRELLLGPRRFTDLRGGLPGISAKVLTERLESLEAAGILTRRHLPAPASAQVYELTPWGYLAEEPVKVLGAWAARSPRHDPTLPLSSASLMISFRTMFDAARAGKAAVRIHLRIAGEDFRARIRKGALTAERGVPDKPDAVITAPTAMPIAALVYGKVPAEALAEAGLAVEGDGAALARFVDCFHLPDKCA